MCIAASDGFSVSSVVMVGSFVCSFASLLLQCCFCRRLLLDFFVLFCFMAGTVLSFELKWNAINGSQVVVFVCRNEEEKSGS